jgi:hypothetical protein
MISSRGNGGANEHTWFSGGSRDRSGGAHVSLALGAGKITGLTLSLPAIKTCVVETITVKGTGKCSDVRVFFGDGNKLITLGKPRPFPQTFQHNYSKMGTYPVSVEAYTGPGSTCTGKASETLQVAAGPWITSMFTLGFFFSSGATPGALVILQGENFGNLPGQAWIHLKKLDGMSAHYQLVLAHPNDWGDTFVAGTIPSISGVLDQQATFTVVAQCGATSNSVSGSFLAARDVVDLAYVGDPPAGGNHWSPWFQCAMSAAPGGNQCENSGSDDWPNECGVTAFGEAGFGNLAAYHAVAWSPNGHPRHDDFWVNGPLLNGWVLLSTSADWTTQVSSGGQVSVDPGWTSAPGTSNPYLQVNWYVNSCSAIFYSGHMFITGPLGVPY